MAAAYARHDPAMLRNASLLGQAIRAASAPAARGFPESGADRPGRSAHRGTDGSPSTAVCAAPRNFPISRSTTFWRNAASAATRPPRAAVRGLLRGALRGAASSTMSGAACSVTRPTPIWLVPHFEKMLYDNAQLLEALALAQADAPEPAFAGRGQRHRRVHHQRVSTRTAPSPRRSTPIRPAAKALSTSGPRPRSTPCWASVRRHSRRHLK